MLLQLRLLEFHTLFTLIIKEETIENLDTSSVLSNSKVEKFRVKFKTRYFYLISVWSTLLVPKSSSVKHLVNYRSDFEAAVAC